MKSTCRPGSLCLTKQLTYPLGEGDEGVDIAPLALLPAGVGAEHPDSPHPGAGLDLRLAVAEDMDNFFLCMAFVGREVS